MKQPQRIQRRRTRGWRMPEGAVYVGRPTKWGNPYHGPDAAERYAAQMQTQLRGEGGVLLEVITKSSLDEIHGKNLACWCSLDQPCHADVLLELANREAAT